jgi:hypothetical protein
VVTVYHRAVARGAHHAFDYVLSKGLRSPADMFVNGKFEILCSQAEMLRTLRMSNTPEYRYRIARPPILGLGWRIGRYSDWLIPRQLGGRSKYLLNELVSALFLAIVIIDAIRLYTA